jgi:hypothetical protein
LTTASNCCAAAVCSNLFSLPDPSSSGWYGALQSDCATRAPGDNVQRKRGERNFIFFISPAASIDAILLTGIAFRQIR